MNSPVWFLSRKWFLGWVLAILWRDLQQQKKTLESQQPIEIRLTIQVGENELNQLFRRSEVIVGREPTCDCVLPSETVSAQHARLSFHHGQWWLEDLKSRNGTFLNEERVNTSVVIAPGDQIRCGKVLLYITEE